jgi:hypothetical protein
MNREAEDIIFLNPIGWTRDCRDVPGRFALYRKETRAVRFVASVENFSLTAGYARDSISWSPFYHLVIFKKQKVHLMSVNNHNVSAPFSAHKNNNKELRRNPAKRGMSFNQNDSSSTKFSPPQRTYSTPLNLNFDIFDGLKKDKQTYQSLDKLATSFNKEIPENLKFSDKVLNKLNNITTIFSKRTKEQLDSLDKDLINNSHLPKDAANISGGSKFKEQF